jgi:transcriptional regulator with PAS, ATPase and Fis domain
MAQQTAVEWFTDKLDELIPFVNEKTAIAFNKLVEQAKKMEKQQIEAAWKRGDGEHDKVADKLAKQYYTETYTNESR